MIRRILDILIVVLATPILVPVGIVIAAAVRLTSSGPALYWSERIGKDNRPFNMPKFRTMKLGTAVVATHLLKDANQDLTPVGGFLRSSSLDEIPQLLSVLKGDMTLIGPRPALFNQDDLIALRTANGIHKSKPGLTGWAQVNGRDSISIQRKVELEKEYLAKASWKLDFRIIKLTLLKVLGRADIAH